MELDQGPVQVLVRALDFEIFISGKMIHEKTQAELKADQPGCIDEQLPVFCAQQAGGLAAVAFHNRGKAFFIKGGFFGSCNLLSGGVTAGTETIAEIVEDKAGHDGVKVDQADCCIGISGKEKVCDLGIAVDYSAG